MNKKTSKKVNTDKKLTLQARHRKAIEMMVYQAAANNEVAAAVDVAPETVSRWRHSDDYKAFQEAYDRELERAGADRKRQYKSYAQAAVVKITSLMNCGDPQVELRAAKEIILLAEDTPPKEIKNTFDIKRSVEDTAAELSEMINALVEYE